MGSFAPSSERASGTSLTAPLLLLGFFTMSWTLGRKTPRGKEMNGRVLGLPFSRFTSSKKKEVNSSKTHAKAPAGIYSLTGLIQKSCLSLSSGLWPHTCTSLNFFFYGSNLILIFKFKYSYLWVSPGGSDSKNVFLQCGRPGFDPWVGKIP